MWRLFFSNMLVTVRWKCEVSDYVQLFLKHSINSMCGLLCDILQCQPFSVQDFARHHSWVIALCIQVQIIPMFSFCWDYWKVKWHKGIVNCAKELRREILQCISVDIHAFTEVTEKTSEYKQTPQYRLQNLI